MADDEELKAENLSPNTLIAWERIRLPSLVNQCQSQSPAIVLSDPHGGGGGWSTPTVGEDGRTSIIFPPTDHEGLNLHNHYDVRDTYNERPCPSSPVLSGLKPEAMGGCVAVKWRVPLFKLPSIVSYIWNCSLIRGGLLRSFAFPLAGSMVLLILFYLRFRLRRRLRREAVNELLSVIKEKDERIHQLLYQIARMNELLLTTHHGVRMISKVASG
ncbi:hypothetical protein L2E82_46613 [Cichorium intybus]|uniref:Uncharacterized protein n=1 Tax=Cichorium intybus TaxID=13427 RepID=A0ACB8YU70_CICIN|nr:hypothetical protein L1887_26325 [Cichorium endivia]KAI3688786.1 hypothetical protein L2E82_46613 [Cichorium intybus]